MNAEKLTRLFREGEAIECPVCEAINVYNPDHMTGEEGIYLAKDRGNGFQCGNCEAEFIDLVEVVNIRD